MVANTITFQQTAKKEISLCIETSFGFEVVVISKRQAERLAEGLKKTISAMPSHLGRGETGPALITPTALSAGFNGA